MSNVVATLLFLPDSRRSDAMDISIMASLQDLVNQDLGEVNEVAGMGAWHQ
jgi:hypothetical protein